MDKKIIEINENYLNFDCDIKETIESVITRYLKNLDNIIQRNKTEEFLHEEYLLIIAECMELFIDKERWIENAYIVMKDLKEKILSGYYANRIGFLDGICNLGFSVNLLNLKTCHFELFKLNLQEYIYMLIEEMIKKNLYDENKLKESHYDLIYGLSGAGIYLLLCSKGKKRDELVEKIIEYTDEIISKTHLYKKQIVPNWHVQSQNHVLEMTRKEYFEGSFNLSVSHGIASIYVFLCRAYLEGIKKDIVKKNIKNIEKIYAQFTVNEREILYFPGRLSLMEYLTKNISFNNYRQSWCYGTVGVNGVFLNIANMMGNRPLEKNMYENILKIAASELQNYELISPIVCHGYAGILEIFLSAYKIKYNSILYTKIYELTKIILDLYEKQFIYGFRNIQLRIEKGEWIIKEIDDNSFLEGANGVVLVLLSLLKKDTKFQEKLLL